MGDGHISPSDIIIHTTETVKDTLNPHWDEHSSASIPKDARSEPRPFMAPCSCV